MVHLEDIAARGAGLGVAETVAERLHITDMTLGVFEVFVQREPHTYAMHRDSAIVTPDI